MESAQWKKAKLSMDEEEEKRMAEYPYRTLRIDYVVLMAASSGDDAVVLETTLTSNKNVVSDWISTVRGPERRSVRSPRVTGISFYKRAFSEKSRRRRHNGGGQKKPLPLPTIAALSICVGGARCLVYVVDSDDLYPVRGGGLYSFVSRELKEFLEDRSVSFVGFGIEKAVAALKVEWGVDVAKTVDAVKLANDVMGKERVFELKTRKKGKESQSSSGHVLAVPVSKEEIVAMVTGVEVEGPPSSVEAADWASVDLITNEMVMHAAADALMSFQVGDALLKKNN